MEFSFELQPPQLGKYVRLKNNPSQMYSCTLSKVPSASWRGDVYYVYTGSNVASDTYESYYLKLTNTT